MTLQGLFSSGFFWGTRFVWWLDIHILLWKNAFLCLDLSWISWCTGKSHTSSWEMTPFLFVMASVQFSMAWCWLSYVYVCMHQPYSFLLIFLLIPKNMSLQTKRTMQRNMMDPTLEPAKKKWHGASLAACQHPPRLCSYEIVKIQSLYILIA